MRLISFAAVSLAVGFSLPMHACAGLIASYQAEGNANDSAGSHDGTLVNGAGFGAGKTGQAFQLNGSNQHVSVPDSPDWAFGNGSFTISLWANFDAIQSGGLGSLPDVFVGQDEGGGSTNKWVFFYDGNGNLAFHINGPGSVFITPPTTFTPSAGNWDLYSLTRSGDTYTFYADGISLGTATTSLIVPDANAPLTIGQAEGLGYLSGRLDDVRVYNYALSGAEIAALSASATPEPGTLTLVGLGAVGMTIVGMRRRRFRSDLHTT